MKRGEKSPLFLLAKVYFCNYILYNIDVVSNYKEEMVYMYKGYIYRHWIVNDRGILKSYVGQVYRVDSNFKPQIRWKRGGIGYAPGEGEKPTYFWNAIQKYGWDNFNHDILLKIESETLEELVFWLDEWEKYYIEKYDSLYNGYNSTSGGNCGTVVSDMTREKIRESQRGKTLSYETRCKIGEASRGRYVSDETRQKISEAKKGQKHTKESKQKMSDSHKGKQISNETRQKISKALVGQPSKLQKKVICLETLQIFDNATKAGEWCGVGRTSIKNHLNGGTKSAGKHPMTGEKLHWSFYDEWLEQQNN